jgi:hypothetical protein
MRKKIISVFLFLSFVVNINGDYVIVSEPEAPVKVLPYDNAYGLGTAHKGDSFKILFEKDDWYHIQYNKLPAWMNSRYVIVKLLDTLEKAETPASSSTQPNTASHPVLDKSSPVPPKVPDATFRQNDLKKNAETRTSKKISGKNQSKQVQTNAPAPIKSVPMDNNVVSSTIKQKDTVPQRDLHPRNIVVDSSVNAKKEPGIPISLFWIILFVLALVGLILLVSFSLKRNNRPRKRNLRIRRSHLERDAVIIANSKINIFNTLTNSSINLTEFLSDMGFKVHFYSDLNNAKTHLLHYVPDVIVVDWQLEQNMQSSIISILSESKITVTMTVLFYNVSSPASMMEKVDEIIHAHYLGATINDQEISRIVSPLFKSSNKEKRFRESVQATALEGDIQKGNLSDVLQFIEMGNKTGCLYIVLETPYGLIYFEKGRILYAASPAKQGKEAVVEILDLTTGHFHFVMDKSTPNRNANHSCLEIVAE